MNVYDLLTPNEQITFKAKDDKVAMACCLVLGGGQVGAQRTSEDGEVVKIPSLTIFNKNASKDIEAYLGCTLSEYLKNNEHDIADCFSSFCYSTVMNRHLFDIRLKNITDEKKKIEYKEKHVKKYRKSVAKWVETAWSYHNALINKMKMEKVANG